MGYWLIGQRTRGTTIGVTVIFLYIFGLLIAGVRVIDVPGYKEDGSRVMLPVLNERGRPVKDAENRMMRVWVMSVAPLSEIRQKPWSIAQVMAGPLGIASGAASLWAAGPDGPTGHARGVRTHARIPEIAILYTAVAGMLNLLAILDSTSRAGRGARK
jgi:hypothetical protein